MHQFLTKISTKCHPNVSNTGDYPSACLRAISLHLSSVLRCTLCYPYLLPPTLGQILLGSQRADGADPRLSHTFDPQHHPAELLPLGHHPVKLLKTGPDLRLPIQKQERSVVQSVWRPIICVHTICYCKAVGNFNLITSLSRTVHLQICTCTAPQHMYSAYFHPYTR